MMIFLGSFYTEHEYTLSKRIIQRKKTRFEIIQGKDSVGFQGTIPFTFDREKHFPFQLLSICLAYLNVEKVQYSVKSDRDHILNFILENIAIHIMHW